MVKTAEEVIKSVERYRGLQAKARYRQKLQMEKLRFVEDLRDDTLSLLKNSGLSDKEVYERFGPTAKTLESWRLREVKNPQMGTIRSVLRILGRDLVIGDLKNDV